MKSRLESILLPLAVAVCFVLGWHFAVRWSGTDIFPTPGEVVTGTVELARKRAADAVFASKFEADQRSHAVAKERERTIQIRMQGAGELVDERRHAAHARLSESRAPAGQVHRTCRVRRPSVRCVTRG